MNCFEVIYRVGASYAPLSYRPTSSRRKLGLIKEASNALQTTTEWSNHHSIHICELD